MERSVLVGILLTLAVGTQAGRAQEEERPECRFFCGFDAELVLEFGDEDEAIVGPLPQLAVWGDRMYLSDQNEPDRIRVFTLSDGTLLDTIGHPGQGPEEFMRIGDLDVDDDGILWVTDQGNQRITLIEAETGEFLTSFRVPFSIPLRSTTLVPDGTVILNAAVPTRERIGFWIHRWHPTEGVIWSAVEATASNPNVQTLLSALGEGNQTVFIAAGDDRYTLDSYSLNGELLRARPVHRDWFADGAQSEPADPHNRDRRSGTWSARSRIVGLYQDEGQLWVIGTTRGDRWKRSREPRHGHVNFGEYFKSVVEVFDATTGVLLFSKDISRDHTMFAGFTSNGYAMAVRQVGPSYRLQLWRFTY